MKTDCSGYHFHMIIGFQICISVPLIWPRTKIVYQKTADKWYEWQRLTTSGTTSDNKCQRVTTNESDWYNDWQRVTKNDDEWQRVTISAIFSFFRTKQEPKTKHPKENYLTLKRTLKRDYWIKSRSKPLRRNINSKRQKLQKQLFAHFLQNRCS